MDRWSKTEHDKPWTDGRGYRDRWRSLVLGEGKPLQSGQTLDENKTSKI
jgi:hypothetical protein